MNLDNKYSNGLRFHQNLTPSQCALLSFSHHFSRQFSSEFRPLATTRKILPAYREKVLPPAHVGEDFARCAGAQKLGPPFVGHKNFARKLSGKTVNANL